MTCATPFLLIGMDADGDKREIECSTLDKAVEFGRSASAWGDFGHSAEAGSYVKVYWMGWEVWGNHPETGVWAVLKDSRTC